MGSHRSSQSIDSTFSIVSCGCSIFAQVKMSTDSFATKPTTKLLNPIFDWDYIASWAISESKCVGKSLPSTAIWMHLSNALVNDSGSFAVVKSICIFRNADCLVAAMISLMHERRCAKVSSCCSQHGHFSESKLHLSQLCPTGNHQNIILLFLIFWYSLCDALTLTISL